MGNQFFYENLGKTATLTYSSQSVYFPATNILTRQAAECWRSRSGVGSGWGTFIITASVNDRLDFNEGGAALVALLTPGGYTADSFCTHLKAQMEAVGTPGAYSWTYLETGANAYHFRVTKASGTLNLLWNTGANKARSIAGTIGFLDTSDDTGALTYTSDYIRIHTLEWLKFDHGTSKDVYGCFIKTHNFQAGATIRFQANDTDSWGSPAVDQTLIVQSDIMAYVWASAQHYRYNLFLISDISNPAGYVKMGILWPGGRFAPTRDCGPNYGFGLNDPSIIKKSSGGQVSSILKDTYKNRSFNYENSPDIASFNAMMAVLGLTKEMFFVEDSVNYLSTSRFVQPIKYDAVHTFADRWNISLEVEDLL